MTGTPSQRQLRRRKAYVGRQPAAKLGLEAHEPHKGACSWVSGRDTAKPDVVSGDTRGCGRFEGRSRALPREAHAPVEERVHELTGLGSPETKPPALHRTAERFASWAETNAKRRENRDPTRATARFVGVSRSHSSGTPPTAKGMNRRACSAPRPRTERRRRR